METFNISKFEEAKMLLVFLISSSRYATNNDRRDISAINM